MATIIGVVTLVASVRTPKPTPPITTPTLGAGRSSSLGYYGYSSYYSDPCIEWDGYTWVNICY